MAFKKLRGVNLPARKQLLIRAICLNYEERPKWERDKIDRLCAECGGEYSAALFDVMCSELSMTEITMKHYVSESYLYKMRKKFYERW